MAIDPMPALPFGSRRVLACRRAQGDHHGYEFLAEITDSGYDEPDPAGLYRARQTPVDVTIVPLSQLRYGWRMPNRAEMRQAGKSRCSRMGEPSVIPAPHLPQGDMRLPTIAHLAVVFAPLPN